MVNASGSFFNVFVEKLRLFEESNATAILGSFVCGSTLVERPLYSAGLSKNKLMRLS